MPELPPKEPSVDVIDGNTPTTSEEPSNQPSSEVYNPDLEILGNYQPTSDAVNTYSMGMKNVSGIFGLPYQFMPHVDPRITYGGYGNEGFGADYASNIIAGMPLLFMAPGRPSFMAGYSKGEKKNVLERVLSNLSRDSVNVDDIISKNGKFYTFKYDVTEFYQVVNPMCRITARLLGIQDKKLNGKDLDKLNWMDVTMDNIKGLGSFINDYLSIPFYIDTDNQISESFGNSVTDTSLASTVDSFSDMGRELMFYLGYGTNQIDSALGTDLASNAENLADMIKGTFHDTIFESIADQIGAVATGGRLIFPKIWSDSDFSRSYNVSLKLRSPDLDNFSVWLNIIVPLCHILGFVSPRMIDGNPNAFMSPPLVRAMYKGFFNVDMGIITSADISKGDDAQWNANGIPTSVDINLTITDLYDVMALTATKSNIFKFDTLDNTAEMDYLMNLCGINIYKPEIGRMMDMYLVNIGNSIGDIPRNIWGNIRSDITQAINNIFRGF